MPQSVYDIVEHGHATTTGNVHRVVVGGGGGVLRDTGRPLPARLAQMGVVLFGAGPDHRLIPPDFAVARVSASGAPPRGGRRMFYSLVAMTEALGYSAVGGEQVVDNVAYDGDTFARLIISRAPRAYQVLIYARPATGSVARLVGAVIANPLRRDPIVFDHKTGTALPHPLIARIPQYLPRDAPTQPRPDYLRTRLRAGASGLELETPPAAARMGIPFTMAPDNSLILQDAVDGVGEAAGVRTIRVPSGAFPMFGNLVLAKRSIALVGENGANLKYGARLLFQPGFGVLITGLAKRSDIRDVAFRGPGANKGIPAGGLFVTPHVRPSGGSDPDEIGRAHTHGCGVLCESGANFTNCKFNHFAGTGHALWGKDASTNKCIIVDCETSKNSGDGFHASGSVNGSQTLWLSCRAIGNGGWGYFDGSYLGSNMIGCIADSKREGIGLGAYAVTDSGAHSTVLGCYTEGSPVRKPPSAIGDKGVVVGGLHSAGFDDAKPGFRLGVGRKAVSPSIKIQRPGGYDLELGQPPITSWKVVALTSDVEPLGYVTRWDLPRARLKYQIEGRAGSRTADTRESFEWSYGGVRGAGLLALSRGVLVGDALDPNSTQKERRLFAVSKPPWSDTQPRIQRAGSFQPGDVILDVSGENYFFRPTRRSGLGRAWQADTHYRIGDLVTESGETYVVASLTVAKAKTGVSGAAMPAFAPGPPTAAIPDNEVVWQHWGAIPDEDAFEVVGRIPATFHVRQVIAARTTATVVQRVVGARVGHTAQATPEVEPDGATATPAGPGVRSRPGGVIWTALVTGPDEVGLRLTNVGDSDITVDSEWRVDVWKR